MSLHIFRLYHQNPNYSDFHTFGCVYFVHLPSSQRNKLSVQSTKCAFMAYSTSQKGFICCDSCSDKFRISRNVFIENQYFFPIIVDLPSSSTTFVDLSSWLRGSNKCICVWMTLANFILSWHSSVAWNCTTTRISELYHN